MDFDETYENVKKELEFDYFVDKIEKYHVNTLAQRKMVNILSYFTELLLENDFQDFYYTNVNRIKYTEYTISSFVRLALRSPNVYKVLKLIVETCDRML